jgi:NADH oxidase (H2O2-forming)
VLATGSKPLVPPIAGVDLAGVTPVRSLKDLVTLRGFAAAGQKAVIVGGGYIGIEVAVVLRQMGLEVDVVEMLPQMLMAATEPEFITDVEKTLDAEGVRLLTNRKVAEFRNRNGRGVDIKLENGETLAADFAVLSVGVVPNIELAAEAGIQMGATLEDLLSYQYATFKKMLQHLQQSSQNCPPIRISCVGSNCQN